MWIQFSFISSASLDNLPQALWAAASSIKMRKQLFSSGLLSEWLPHFTLLTSGPLAMLHHRSPLHILSPLSLWPNGSVLVLQFSNPKFTKEKNAWPSSPFHVRLQILGALFLSHVFSPHTVNYNWCGRTQDPVAGLATAEKISIEGKV